jgi:hypothetical protein
MTIDDNWGISAERFSKQGKRGKRIMPGNLEVAEERRVENGWGRGAEGEGSIKSFKRRQDQARRLHKVADMQLEISGQYGESEDVRARKREGRRLGAKGGGTVGTLELKKMLYSIACNLRNYPQNIRKHSSPPVSPQIRQISALPKLSRHLYNPLNYQSFKFESRSLVRLHTHGEGNE